jgi:hypothetical protein
MEAREPSYDARLLVETLKEKPELFPNHAFGISRIQRALKLGYGRASLLVEEAIELNILKRSEKPWQLEVVSGKLN